MWLSFQLDHISDGIGGIDRVENATIRLSEVTTPDNTSADLTPGDLDVSLEIIQQIVNISVGNLQRITVSDLHMAVRDISLTLGAGGLLNRWGDHSILRPYFGGITQFQVPFMGGSTNHHHGGIIKLI